MLAFAAGHTQTRPHTDRDRQTQTQTRTNTNTGTQTNTGTHRKPLSLQILSNAPFVFSHPLLHIALGFLSLLNFGFHRGHLGFGFFGFFREFLRLFLPLSFGVFGPAHDFDQFPHFALLRGEFGFGFLLRRLETVDQTLTLFQKRLELKRQMEKGRKYY